MSEYNYNNNYNYNGNNQQRRPNNPPDYDYLSRQSTAYALPNSSTTSLHSNPYAQRGTPSPTRRNVSKSPYGGKEDEYWGPSAPVPNIESNRAASRNGNSNRKPVPKRRGLSLCCKWCIGISIILVVAIALVVFFLFPRKPDIQVLGVQERNDGTEMVTYATDGSEIRLNFGIIMNVKNPNYISIDFNSIKAKGFVFTANGQRQFIGEGLVKAISFPSQSSKRFVFPFSVVLNQQTRSDAVVDVFNKCGLSGTNGRGPIKLLVSLDLDFKVIAFTGYVPTIETTQEFNCPVDLSSTAEDIKKYIDGIARAIS